MHRRGHCHAVSSPCPPVPVLTGRGFDASNDFRGSISGTPRLKHRDIALQVFERLERGIQFADDQFREAMIGQPSQYLGSQFGIEVNRLVFFVTRTIPRQMNVLKLV